MHVQEILQSALIEVWKDTEFPEIVEDSSLLQVQKEGEMDTIHKGMR